MGSLRRLGAAAVIGGKLGRPGLKYVAFPYDDAEKGMVAMGLTPDLASQLWASLFVAAGFAAMFFALRREAASA